MSLIAWQAAHSSQRRRWGSGMRILTDTREQSPYAFERYEGTTITPATLQVGDYAPAGLERLCAVERKSLPDLIASLSQGRERFEKEMVRGQALQRFWLVVEANVMDVRNHGYRSKMQPHAVFQSLAAWEVRYGVRVVWAGSREGGEYLTHSLLTKFVKQLGDDLSACMGDVAKAA